MPPVGTSVKSFNTTEIQDFRLQFDAFVNDYFSERIAAAALLSPNYVKLWQILHDSYLAGGKRLRPYLAEISRQMYNPAAEPVSSSWQIGAALELLHSAMLLHDDIIDRDLIRHGKANAISVYKDYYTSLSDTVDAQHAAESTAILGGDILLAESYSLLLDTDLAAPIKEQLLHIFRVAVFNVIGGELLDSEASLLPIGTTDGLTIAIQKTASYSFVLPLKTGALQGGADASQLLLVEQLGQAAGIAYQLADDELGVFGDELVTGKSSSGDIREGKRTLLINLALELAIQTDQAYLLKTYGTASITDTEQAEVRQIIIRSGALERHKAIRQQYSDQALMLLQQLPDNVARAKLEQLLISLFDREK